MTEFGGTRGVSEVIGFVLVFSLVTASVGAVYAFGYEGLERTRDAEQVNNAERAFDVLADNLEDIYVSDAPNRATEIKLADSQLGFDDRTEITLAIDSTSGIETYGVGVDPIVYDDGSGTRIVYEAGAVIRTDGPGGVMLREPVLVFKGGTMLLQLIETRIESGTSTSVSGSSTVLVRSESITSDSGVLTVTDDIQTATLTVDTTESRAPVWERYLESELSTAAGITDPTTGDDFCQVTGGNAVSCTFVADEVRLSNARIDVGIY